MAKKKTKKSKPTPTVRHTPLPSLLAPGEVTPTPAPSFEDQTKKTQNAISVRMSQAGKKAYGHPITMEDAVATRIKYVEDAIARSGNGVPAGIGWYDQHQQDVRDITEKANEGATNPVSAGRVANATGPLSIRNNPRSEVRAARSAGWIASHPDEPVDITGSMSEAVTKISEGKVTVPEGTHRIGHLSGEQVAMLGRAETDVVRKHGGTRSLNRAVTSATLDSSGRFAAAKAVDLARGANFDEVVKDGPKIHNYVAQTHLANPKESAYNREVFWRRANDTSVDDSGTKWQQGHLFSASELTGFDPSTSANISVEDYIGHAMSAEVASKKGKRGASARKAQDIAIPKKGKAGALPADMTPSEMAHAFHEHATRKAAEHFIHTSFTNEGDVKEAPTALGIQPVTWTEWQTQHNAPAAPKQPRIKNQPTLF